MAYDMHGASDSVTGYNAPLFKGEGDENADPKSLYTVENAVDYWLGAGNIDDYICIKKIFKDAWMYVYRSDNTDHKT